MKTLRVKVVRGNKPVPMATVVVTGSGLVLHGQTYTAMDGITGSDPQGDAIVITTELYEATDDPKAPEVRRDFHYTVTATAGGKSASRDLLSSDFSSPFVISLP